MSPVKIYTALFFAILMGVAAALGGQQILRWKRGSEQAEQQKGVMQSTAGGVQDSIDIDEFQAGYNAALQRNRDTFQQTKREAIRNEPETAKRAVAVVPNSVRRAARERRLARERLGCAGRECPKDDDANAAAER